jgi:hypothetical protein
MIGLPNDAPYAELQASPSPSNFIVQLVKLVLALLAFSSPVFAQAPPVTDGKAAGDKPLPTPAIPAATASGTPSAPASNESRLYAARVIVLGENGVIIEGAAVPPGAPAPGVAPESVRFFLRGAPNTLLPASDIRFYATEDVPYRYTDFFNMGSTLRALRFVKWEPKVAPPTTPPVAPSPVTAAGVATNVAPATPGIAPATPGVAPAADAPRATAGTPATPQATATPAPVPPKPIDKNPTPRLKGTSLDLPPRRIGR